MVAAVDILLRTLLIGMVVLGTSAEPPSTTTGGAALGAATTADVQTAATTSPQSSLRGHFEEKQGSAPREERSGCQHVHEDCVSDWDCCLNMKCSSIGHRCM